MLSFEGKKNGPFLAPSSMPREENHSLEKEVENTFLCDPRVESLQVVALWLGISEKRCSKIYLALPLYSFIGNAGNSNYV